MNQVFIVNLLSITMRTKPFFLLSILLLLLGCNKDSDEDQLLQNYFSIDGTIYELASGYMANGGVYLFSEGFSISGLEQSTNDPILSGSGNMLSIAGITGQQSISTGTYDLNVVEGEVYVNYDPALTTSDYHQFLNAGSGTCKITLNGLNCSVSIEGTLSDNKSLVLTYSGLLTEVTE